MHASLANSDSKRLRTRARESEREEGVGGKRINGERKARARPLIL